MSNPHTVQIRPKSVVGVADIGISNFCQFHHALPHTRSRIEVVKGDILRLEFPYLFEISLWRDLMLAFMFHGAFRMGILWNNSPMVSSVRRIPQTCYRLKMVVGRILRKGPPRTQRAIYAISATLLAAGNGRLADFKRLERGRNWDI